MSSRQPALQVSLLEPVILLRSAKDPVDGVQYDRPAAAQDEIGSYEHVEESLNQLRGLVSLNHDRLPADSSQVQISFRGVSVWVEWTGECTQCCEKRK